ncbi:DUF5671 domain-containing protein [Palleronia sp. LCG004]|uniref:DUF5671 domain-containing protein n=1 Tax=Palleronia sp. LCG004 TaxID=3079304 RepID=UPI002942923E|nr:DUF5671 domain-containing protein [Palleronia sp. LCG004]WOI56483.1 DUF5671 domain-containing protein [Palleronia sp. LCG004]
MARGPALDTFVRDALMAGRSRDEIDRVLVEAGWSTRDVERALATYADIDFSPPVPRRQPYVSARDAFFYGLTFVALVVVVANLVSASFKAIEWALETRDHLRLNWNVAALVVFAPVFAILDRRVRGDDRETPMRKIFAYGALFLASLVLLVDLVAAIALAIGGGLGVEVASKAGVVALVAALVLLYYRADLSGDAGTPRRTGR